MYIKFVSLSNCRSMTLNNFEMYDKVKIEFREAINIYSILLQVTSLIPRLPPGCPGNTLSVVARLQELLFRELDRLKCRQKNTKGTLCPCRQCGRRNDVKKFLEFVDIKIKYLAKIRKTTFPVGRTFGDIWYRTGEKRPAEAPIEPQAVPRYIHGSHMDWKMGEKKQSGESREILKRLENFTQNTGKVRKF